MTQTATSGLLAFLPPLPFFSFPLLGKRKMKIFTWNVNGLRTFVNYDPYVPASFFPPLPLLSLGLLRSLLTGGTSLPLLIQDGTLSNRTTRSLIDSRPTSSAFKSSRPLGGSSQRRWAVHEATMVRRPVNLLGPSLWFIPFESQLDDLTSRTSPSFNPTGFFNFPASQKGYSGVATYTRHSTLVPFRAEEGLAGTTINPPTNFLNPPLAPHEQIGAYPSSHSPLCSDRPQHDQDDDAEEEGDEGGSDKGEDGTTEDSSRRGLSSEELRALDLEGRCVVVDVGLFVLINVYCPNETNDERLPYKMNFLRTLEARVRGLIKAGREVMLVGKSFAFAFLFGFFG
jgi:exonuclease III